MRVLNKAFDQPLRTEEKAVAPLAGGIMQYGYQCGMIWGASLAAGAYAYQHHDRKNEAQIMALLTASKLVDTYRTMKEEIDCYNITNINKSSSKLKMLYIFLIKGKTFSCMNMSARYAKAAFSVINSMDSKPQIEAPLPPFSCTVELAQKVGLSDMHTTMVSGLAGGIGLCGGACGAIAAAIWMYALKNECKWIIDYNDSKALNLLDSFLKFTGYQFECSEIVGKKFSSINDHADYLKHEGCKKNIEMLASKLALI